MASPPPPQAQHISIESKSSSSYPPHQSGYARYSTQPSPYVSVAPLSVSEQSDCIARLREGRATGTARVSFGAAGMGPTRTPTGTSGVFVGLKSERGSGRSSRGGELVASGGLVNLKQQSTPAALVPSPESLADGADDAAPGACAAGGGGAAAGSGAAPLTRLEEVLLEVRREIAELEQSRPRHRSEHANARRRADARGPGRQRDRAPPPSARAQGRLRKRGGDAESAGECA